MNNTNEQNHLAQTDCTAPAIPRFQIYPQTHTGTFSPEFNSDSALEIVEAFLNQSPAIERGEVRIWNHREQRVSASVEWTTEKTDLGFPVFNRTSVFHDGLLGVIVRQLQIREEIREQIQHSVRVSA